MLKILNTKSFRSNTKYVFAYSIFKEHLRIFIHKKLLVTTKSPSVKTLVGLRRLELLTPRLSSVCSNQLSYRPISNLANYSFKTEQLVCLFKSDKGALGLKTNELRSLLLDPKILRKEVIQPQVPLRLPCYDFTPIINHTLGACFLAVSAATSGTTNFHGVTGGVYKARERIHRGVLIRDY